MHSTSRLALLTGLLALLAGCGGGGVTGVDIADDVWQPPFDGVSPDKTGDISIGDHKQDLPDDDVEYDFTNNDNIKWDNLGETGEPKPGEFGYPCETNSQCLSGYCVETWEGKVCTEACVEECPSNDWSCTLIANSCPDCQYICIPRFVHLCQPCRDNNDCGGEMVTTGDRCVPFEGYGKFCGGECAQDKDCPDGFECREIELESETVSQCVPISGVCECSDLSIKQGRSTTCYRQNEFGLCLGDRMCTPMGMSECSAPIPKPEECNGIDDDCNNIIDDTLAQSDCEVTNVYGTCRGSYACIQGKMTCDAPQPKPEVCNGLDDDCDGIDDEGFSDSNGDGIADCQSEDDDGDGKVDWEDNCPNHFNPGQENKDLDSMGDLCDPDDDNDMVADTEDCEPYNNKIYPDAVEQCDGLDNNCDGKLDDGYADFDLDGKADCIDPDDDNDGINDTIDNCVNVYNPDQLNTDGAPDGGDVCDFDDDNDGLGDNNDNCPQTYNVLQTDTDGDGVGDACQGDKDGDTILDEDDNCELVFNPDQLNSDNANDGGNACDDDDDNDGEIDNTDCEPTNPMINHYSIEICDGNDNNCNGLVDELGGVGCKEYFLDQDGDDYGAQSSKCLCGPYGLFSAESMGDCNDFDPTVNPGMSENCNTTKDENCNGSDNDENAIGCIPFYFDQDGDNFGTQQSKCYCAGAGKYTAATPGDCNDNDILINPGQNEVCGNFIDDNCNGDQNDPNAIGCNNYYRDADNDGFGVTLDFLCLCSPFGSYSTQLSGDCNDSSTMANPNMSEICQDGIDNNCNGTSNDENAVGCTYWYADGDGDGYGNPADGKCFCSGYGKWVTKQVADCNDLVPSVNPAAAEVCNGADDNCNGLVDEGPAQALCSQALPHVEQVSCVGGKCVAGGCAPGWWDVNQNTNDGCECKDDNDEQANKSCSYAKDLGTLTDAGAGTSTTVSGNDPDKSGDWFRVLAQDSPETNTDNFHVRVKFVKNSNDNFVFDLYWGGCGASLQICGEATDAEWFTDFSNPAATTPWPPVPGPTTYGGGESKCRPDSNHELTPTNYGDDTDELTHRCTDNTKQFFIKVYTAPGKQATCNNYELEISNGL